MEFALGILHWHPSEFWNSSFYEYCMASCGYIKSQGGGNKTEPLTRNELLDLMDKSGTTKSIRGKLKVK